jgi:hypothetical protein
VKRFLKALKGPKSRGPDESPENGAD